MGTGELLMILALAATGGAVWFVGEMVSGVSHRETGPPVTHLCSDGEFKPGPMEKCACRDEWAGAG